jgi:hypothetical protein
MKSSKSSISVPKTAESSWAVDSMDIVRTWSKSLVKGGPNSIDKTDLSNELDAFRLFWNEKLEKGLLEHNNKKMAPISFLWKTFVVIFAFLWLWISCTFQIKGIIGMVRNFLGQNLCNNLWQEFLGSQFIHHCILISSY